MKSLILTVKSSVLPMYFIISIVWMVTMSCKAGNDSTYKKIPLTAQERQLIANSNTFGLDLFRAVNVAEADTSNLMISPVSVALALGMTYNGADGTTKTAMEQALRMQGFTDSEINKAYRKLILSLLSLDPQVELSIANSIWYRNTFKVQQSFIDINKMNYDAEIAALDFKSPQSPGIINKWIADKTNDKIKNVIKSIDPQTVMFLVNAIYFNGKWKHPFDEKNTSRRPFIIPGETNHKVMSMMMNADFRHGAQPEFDAIEIPYGQGNYNMIILLPNKNKTVNDVIASLNGENLDEWMNQMKKTDVQLTMPKFKFSFEKQLEKALTGMGMGIAFDSDKANFAKINPDPINKLFISQVQHNTFVDVSEKGTEAAAVTVVVIGMSSTSLRPEPYLFTVDRPFVFMITEKETHAVMFIGKVINPHL